MIREQLIEIGRFNKPHGVNGEISASADVDISQLSCIIVNMDGIDVPFFVNSVRTKGPDTVLLKIDGYDSEPQVKIFVNKDIYALASEVEIERDEDDDGFYASDFIGFTAVENDGTTLGEITDIDDNTENVLFIIRRIDSDRPLFIPVVPELIEAIDTAAGTITFILPEGLKDL